MSAKLKVSAVIAAVLCAADGLSAPRVLAESQEERQACISDAFQFCLKAIPDHNSVLICLLEHKSLISVACQMAIARHASVDQTSAKDDRSHPSLSSR